MAYDSLKSLVRQYINTNAENEITGQILQNVLITMIDELGSEYSIEGIATPTTNPGSPSGKAMYFASQAGTYTYFDGDTLPLGIHLLVYNGTSWSHQTFFAVDATPTSGSNNFISSGAVFDALKKDGGAYDVTAHNNGATFASLQALLSDANLSTYIPTTVRKGGMSIKFVQTSDNKYVSYFYTGTDVTGTPDPFLNISNWQKYEEKFKYGNQYVKEAYYSENDLEGYTSTPRLRLATVTQGNVTLYLYDGTQFIQDASVVINQSTYNGEPILFRKNAKASFTIISLFKEQIASLPNGSDITVDIVNGGLSYLTDKLEISRFIETSLLSTGLTKIKYNAVDFPNKDTLLKDGGYLATITGFNTTDFISLENIVAISFSAFNYNVGSWVGVALYDENFNCVGCTGGAKTIYMSDYPSAKYVVFGGSNNISNNSYYKLYNSNDIQKYGNIYVKEAYYCNNDLSQYTSDVKLRFARTSADVIEIYLYDGNTAILPKKNISAQNYDGEPIVFRANLKSSFTVLSFYKDEIELIPQGADFSVKVSVGNISTLVDKSDIRTFIGNNLIEEKLSVKRKYTSDEFVNKSTLLKDGGSYADISNFNTSNFILLDDVSSISFSVFAYNQNTWVGVCLYDEGFNCVYSSGGTGTIYIVDHPTAKYAVFGGASSGTHYYEVHYKDELNDQLYTKNTSDFGGRYDSLNNMFSGEGSRTLWSTITNSASAIDGIIDTICVNVGAADTYTIGVGVLDQNYLAIFRTSFDIYCPSAGINVINVFSKHVTINTGEQLFYYGSEFVKWDGNIHSDNRRMVWGNIGSIGTDADRDDRRVCLKYSVLSLDSIFVNIGKLESIMLEMDSMKTSIQKLQKDSMKAYSSDRTPYRLKVLNGNVVATSGYYHKALCMGNSLTYHVAVELRAWYVNRGMAATRPTLTWPEQVEIGLKQQDVNAECVAFIAPSNSHLENITTILTDTDWEEYFTNYNMSEYDLFIVSLGENVSTSNVETFITNLSNMVKYIQENYLMDIVLCSSFWSNIYSRVEEVAGTCKVDYVDFWVGSSNQNTWRNKFGYIYANDDDSVYYVMRDTGPVGHCGDLAFNFAASKILYQLGYEDTKQNHNINVVSSTDNYGIQPYGIKDGIVTVILYENGHTVTASANGNPLTVTYKDLSQERWQEGATELTPSPMPLYCYYFVMPDTDVDVNIS